MIRAKDVMNKEVISIKKDAYILEAVQLLVENNISCLPVVKDNMTLVGMLSEKDAVEVFYEVKGIETQTVEKYMTYPVVDFNENVTVLEVCDFLSRNIFRRVPVTSNGKLTGIISIRDVLNYILEREQEKTIEAKKEPSAI